MHDEIILQEKRAMRKAALLLLGLGSPMLTILIVNFIRDANHLFTHVMGFNETALEIPLAWVLAIVLAVGYVIFTAKAMPEVRKTMFRLDWLKVIAIFTTVIGAGIVEELVFRRMLMNWLYSHGIHTVFQIVISGVTFGIGHSVWGLFSKGGSKSMALGAALATTVLGVALATIYIVAARNVLPVIVAHALINFCNEPGMLLHAMNSSAAKIEKVEVSESQK